MVLVTGATGHVGNVLVKSLLQRGEKVKVLVLPNDDMSPLQGLNVEKVVGDVRIFEDVKRALEGVDVVYHLAAIISIGGCKKKLVWDVNVNGVENLLKAVRHSKVKRVLYMSSVHAFAELKKGSLINEDVPFDPNETTGVYGKSKATAALKVLNATKNGMDAVIVCPTGIIGPYDYKHSEMGTMILRFLYGKLPVGIEGSFDFVDVRDVVNGAIMACERSQKGEVYILSGERVEMKWMMDELRKISHKEGPRRLLKKGTAKFLAHISMMNSMLKNEKAIFTPYSVYTLTRDYTFSHEKATQEFGYSPRSISKTLKDTVNWLVKYYGIEILKAS